MYNNCYVPRNLSICTKMYQSLSSYASSIHNMMDLDQWIDLSRVCVCVCVCVYTGLWDDASI